MAFAIGALAKATDVHVEIIHYYQRRSLLEEPIKPPGGIRSYGEAHARRLRFIKHAQALGFSLDEVGDLLALEDGRHSGRPSGSGQGNSARCAGASANCAGSSARWPNWWRAAMAIATKRVAR